jgi:hypothetical protein
MKVVGRVRPPAMLLTINPIIIMQKNILEIIQKIEWSDVVDSNTLVSANGWKLSYSINLHYSGEVQVVFRLSKSDVYVLTWGCSENDQRQAVVAFLDAKNEAYRIGSEADDKISKQAKALLASL